MPDLVLVESNEGDDGYVYRADLILEDELPRHPAEAVDYQARKDEASKAAAREVLVARPGLTLSDIGKDQINKLISGMPLDPSEFTEQLNTAAARENTARLSHASVAESPMEAQEKAAGAISRTTLGYLTNGKTRIGSFTVGG